MSKQFKKDLGVVIISILMVGIVVGIFFAGFKAGYEQSTKNAQGPIENEIRLVQEKTARQIVDMFLNIEQVREAMKTTSGNIYTCKLYWWNFDRQFELTRHENGSYTEGWCDLQR